MADGGIDGRERPADGDGLERPAGGDAVAAPEPAADASLPGWRAPDPPEPAADAPERAADAPLPGWRAPDAGVSWWSAQPAAVRTDAPWYLPAPYARRAVGDAFRLLVRSPRHFVAGAMVVGIIDALLGAVATDLPTILALGLLSGLAAVLYLAYAASLTRQYLEGESASVAQAVRAIRTHARPLVAALVWLYAVPTVAILGLTAWGVNAAMAGRLEAADRGAVMGFLLLAIVVVVVFGSLLAFRFLYTVPAIVTDGLGFRDAARASWRASGRRLRAGLFFGLVAGFASARPG